MKRKQKNILRSASGLIIGGLFLYFTLRDKPLGPVWESLAETDVFWVFVSFCCLVFIFFFRALRWQVLLESGRGKLLSDRIFTALLLGYFVNSFTPKLGEIIRCTSLHRTTGIPVPRAMGSVLAERAYDLLILILGLVTIFILEIDRMQGLIDATIGGISHIYGYRYFLAAPFLIAAFIILLLFSLQRKKDIHYKPVRKVVEFLQQMFTALKHGFLLKRAGTFFFLTLLIWIFLVLLNVCFLKALPETHGFPIPFAVIILFVGGIGWALPSPGGIGTTHFFLLQLFVAYQQDPQSGISFGILSNGLTFLFTILLGGWGWYRYEIEKLDSRATTIKPPEHQI
ncbi:MAG: lysylphosphatidylglycerol synthase transmembrane domain-containing protein [Marinifilaceae bacterium]